MAYHRGYVFMGIAVVPLPASVSPASAIIPTELIKTVPFAESRSVSIRTAVPPIELKPSAVIISLFSIIAALPAI